MLLIVVATENEQKPLREFLATAAPLEVLVTGMGPVATAFRLSSYLTRYGPNVGGVLNIGVAGAYTNAGLSILDICLARQEFFGDFGICMQDHIQDFAPELLHSSPLLLFDNDLTQQCAAVLAKRDIAFKNVNFVTVNCCTGSRERGEFLRDKFAAGCENMEGAAVAMVCREFAIPCAELRCISNMVEARDPAKWRLNEAIEKVCQATGAVLPQLME